MSFSSDIKEELSKVNNYKNKEILMAELLGYILTGNTSDFDTHIEYITENEFNIERFYKILFNLEIDYEPMIDGKCFVAKINKNSKLDKVFEIISNNNEEIQKAIVKGAFMGSGSVSNPNKQYHLEIPFNEVKNAEIISNICKKYEVNLKIIESKGKYNIYIKDGEEISKFLALITSNKGVMEFEDIRIQREIKNKVNRYVNCETANLNKTVNAAVDQINDIKYIKKMKKFDELPNYLKEIAEVRLENPELSLKALGELLEKPIGKSGVNHRLQKIHEIAEELKR